MVNTNKLKGLFAEHGLTQGEVADYLGITAITLRRKLKDSSFDVKQAEKLCQLLDIKDPSTVFFCREM